MISTLLGIQLVRVTLRFLRETDEFMRKAQLEGIAMSSGAGFVFCMAYFVLEQAGAPALPVLFAALPMGIGWCIGSFVVAARHR